MNKLLYKYLPDAAIGYALEPGTFRFSQMDSLNDPFEANPLVQIADEFRGLFNKPLSALAIATDPVRVCNGSLRVFDIPIEEIFTPDWQGVSVEKWAELLNPCLNDPAVLTDPDKLGRLIHKVFLNNIGVLSLSRTFDNQLMWAHYCNEHKGLVIGIDPMLAFPAEIQQFQSGDQLICHDVVYRSKRSVVTIGGNEFYSKYLAEKPLDWIYEQEVRVTARLEAPLTINGQKDGLDVWVYKLPHEAIKEVYLGARMSDEHAARVHDICESNYPHAAIRRARPSRGHYELDFEDIT